MEPSHLPAVSSPFPGRCPLGARSRRQRAGAARVAPVEAPTVPRAGGAWGRLAPAGLPGVPAARGGVGGVRDRPVTCPEESPSLSLRPGRARAAAAPLPLPLPPRWRSPAPVGEGCGVCELRAKGRSRARCLSPAPAPLRVPPPLVTGTDELIMMWLLLMHLCGAGCATGSRRSAAG